MDSQLLFSGQGKVIVIGGDFHEVFPTVARGSQARTINASLMRFYLWRKMEGFSIIYKKKLPKTGLGTHSASYTHPNLKFMPIFFINLNKNTLQIITICNLMH